VAKEHSVSDRKLMGAAGNAWPVHVVAKLIRNAGEVMGWQQ